MMELLTGLFAGSTVVLIYLVVQMHKNLATLDRERKRWINKSVVKDGQIRVFPDEEIETEKIDYQPKSTMKVISPFKRGLSELKDSVKTDKQIENGSYLPDAIKEKLKTAAEAVKQ